MAIVEMQPIVGEVKFFPKKTVKLTAVESSEKTSVTTSSSTPTFSQRSSSTFVTLPDSLAVAAKTRAVTPKSKSPLISSTKASKIDMWTGILAFSLLATVAYLIAEKGE